jgi:hypothetical protein
MDSKIELRNIRSLSGMNFFIPDYQRGYRWSGKQVERMLDDFKEFCVRNLKKETAPGEFYCLQPIVVKAKTWIDSKTNESVDGYEVIDGQQRLTTLYILLKYLHKRNVNIPRSFKLYSIKYETRLAYDSQAFLEQIDNPSQKSNDFVDFYYMTQVYNAINQWFEPAANEQFEAEIGKALLSEIYVDDEPQDLANNIRVIWYEVIDNVEDDSVDTSINIFTRLNIGKIPLTNAELIKALLLRKGNFDPAEEWLRQVQISTEWNIIEQTLQDDDFWYFIHSAEDDYANRIEYLFDKMKKRTRDSEFYHTFVEFSRELESMKSEKIQLPGGKAVKKYPTEQSRVEKVWSNIKEFYQMLKEWYDDRELYHYIGYLIENGYDIIKLMDASRKKDKDVFLSFVKDEIKGMLKGIDIETLSYGDSATSIRRVLLLFNILTVLQTKKSDMRFPFSKFKKEKWDIEHISSQTDKNNNLSDSERQHKWLTDLIDFFVGGTSSEEIDNYKANAAAELEKLERQSRENPTIKVRYDDLKQELQLVDELLKLHNSEKINEGAFEQVFNTAQKLFGENKVANINHIRNLALLDAVTNRGYGNAFFPVKRKWIIRNDEKGIFVPIATKNVFLKFYSPRVNKMMRWEQHDADCYFNVMKSLLAEYLTPQNNG